MINLLGAVLMIMGGINIAWFLLWSLMTWSGTLGAKISKKIGTDNDQTDATIAIGQDFKKKLLSKVIISSILAAVGAIMFFLIK